MPGTGEPDSSNGGAPHPDMRSRTLVIQTAFLGDVVLSTGLLSRLAQRAGPVDLLTTPAARALMETHPAVARVLVYDKRGSDRGVQAFFRLAATLRANRYATAYLPHRSVRSALLARAAGIAERIGFEGSPGALWYTRAVARPGGGHEAERLLALADPDPGETATISLGLTAGDRAAAATWLESQGVGNRFLAIAPGSIWGTKRWPGYPDLVQRTDLPVVVIGGPEDRELGLIIAAAAPERVKVAAGELSLRASAALIDRAALLVTNDSAPLHLAGAVGTRTIAIFGPTIPAFGFGPRGKADRVVESAGLDCRPCSPHGPEVCPLGHHRCMREIGVERVLEAMAAQDQQSDLGGQG